MVQPQWDSGEQGPSPLLLGRAGTGTVNYS